MYADFSLSFSPRLSASAVKHTLSILNKNGTRIKPKILMHADFPLSFFLRLRASAVKHTFSFLQ